MGIVLPGSKGKIVGPWPCEKCGQLSQCAETRATQNRIFCLNERCGYTRIVDMGKKRVLESDGTLWEYDTQTGRKTRITGQ